MKKYLDNKYGQSFVVENYRIEGGGFAVEGDPTADAYPEGEPSMKFEIRDRGHYSIGKHSYWDDYAATVWQKQETKLLKPLIEARLATPNPPDYRIEIHLRDTSPTARMINEANFPAFDEIRTKYSHDLSYNFSATDYSSGQADHYRTAEELIKIVKERAVDAHTSFSYKWSTPEGDHIIYMEKRDIESILSGNGSIKDFERLKK